jgi:hypothetical protein
MRVQEYQIIPKKITKSKSLMKKSKNKSRMSCRVFLLFTIIIIIIIIIIDYVNLFIILIPF